VHPSGIVHSELDSRKDSPKQGFEEAPEAWIERSPRFMEAIDGLAQNCNVIIRTWFHQAVRDILKVHPCGDLQNPLSGVFATRSPDRPNPIGLHRGKVREIYHRRGLRVYPLETLNGAPVIDIKPMLGAASDDQEIAIVSTQTLRVYTRSIDYEPLSMLRTILPAQKSSVCKCLQSGINGNSQGSHQKFTCQVMEWQRPIVAINN